MIFRQLFDKDTSTYTYLIADEKTKEAAIIDPVREQVDRDVKLIEDLGLKLKYAIETHVHADHVTGGGSLRQVLPETEVVVGKPSGVECADVLIADADVLKVGDIEIKALYTPGHTDTCTTYMVDDMVFTGDTLLIGGCGRTDFQAGDPVEGFIAIIPISFYYLPDHTLDHALIVFWLWSVQIDCPGFPVFPTRFQYHVYRIIGLKYPIT